MATLERMAAHQRWPLSGVSLYYKVSTDNLIDSYTYHQSHCEAHPRYYQQSLVGGPHFSSLKAECRFSLLNPSLHCFESELFALMNRVLAGALAPPGGAASSAKRPEMKTMAKLDYCRAGSETS